MLSIRARRFATSPRAAGVSLWRRAAVAAPRSRRANSNSTRRTSGAPSVVITLMAGLRVPRWARMHRLRFGACRPPVQGPTLPFDQRPLSSVGGTRVGLCTKSPLGHQLMHTPPGGVASPPSPEPAWLARSRGSVSDSHRSFFSSPSRLAHHLAQSSPDPVEADLAVRELWHAQEAVHLTDGATVVHRDRGTVKVLRVGLALVAEH